MPLFVACVTVYNRWLEWPRAQDAAIVHYTVRRRRRAPQGDETGAASAHVSDGYYFVGRAGELLAKLFRCFTRVDARDHIAP